MPRLKITLVTLALFFSTLACRAATRLIIPDTPTPLPPTPTPPTFTPTPIITPTLTPTPLFEASCPLVLEDIVGASLNFEGDSSDKTEEDTYLVVYSVDGDEISHQFYNAVPESLRDEQDDRETHRELWNYFTRLIPITERRFVSEFSIATDGSGHVLAAVGQNDDDPQTWVLEVDILDSSDKYALTFTLIHEFAHLLTLNSSQVPPDLGIFDNPYNDEIYQRELAACPNYFHGEGCSNSNSYINQFFDRFWLDLFAEWREIDSEEDEDTYYSLLDEFYDTYQDQFLTDYAPTSPAEDIAESFAFFILSPKPELNSIANEKILFFYEFPELVELRRQIVNQVCAEFPQ